MKKLIGPQADDRVRHDPPPGSGDSEAIRQNSRQVRPLRAVAPQCVLDVWKTRSVLEVEKGSAVEIPGHEVCAAGELEMLVRLVDRHVESQTAEVGGFELTHRGVHGVRVAEDWPASPVSEDQLGSQVQRRRDPCVGLERHGSPGFELLHERGRDAGAPGTVAERHTAADPLVSDRLSSDRRHSEQRPRRSRRRGETVPLWRHSTSSEQDPPHRARNWGNPPLRRPHNARIDADEGGWHDG